MRLCRVEHANKIWIARHHEQSCEIHLLFEAADYGDSLIALIGNAEELSLKTGSAVHIVGSDAVRYLPPISQPSKNILCVGKNYRAHAAEFANSGFDNSQAPNEDSVPRHPIVFSKAPCTMTGAFERIEPPWKITQKVDYEAELGVVIGKTGRNIQRDKAYQHVFGYTIINDVTARDLQAQHKQWLLGKSIDTFCPIGPWVATSDEVEPENLDVKCWVNGELRQHANTRDLIFDIPTIIETISASMTLNPGDIIATGTPAGVGIGFDPPKFLQPGDLVKIKISTIGTIENRVL
ncbi:MAG: fumarylacetoacetate hydrolase family protein [Pseudomonadota bacterium]